MQYTIENLRTQLSLKERALEQEKVQCSYVMGADFALAKEYGESVRVNHLRTINNRMSYIERQIMELELKISEME